MFLFNRNSTDGAECADNSNTSGSTNDDLYKLFLETLISYGLPAFFKIVVIGVSATVWRSVRSDKKDGFDDDLKNPAADLYRDLYGGDDEEEKSGGFVDVCTDLLKGGIGGGSKDGDGDDENKNRGVPGNEYITVRSLNKRFDSYQYSLTAATESRAAAAADYRAKKFDRAVRTALVGATGTTVAPSAHIKTKLLRLEKEFLINGSALLEKVLSIQTLLTKDVIDDKMEEIGMTCVYELDPKTGDDNDKDKTAASSATEKSNNKKRKKKEKEAKKKMTKQLTELNEEQKNLMALELDFFRDVVETLGSGRAAGLRAAFLGDVAVRGSGGILTQIRERPLTTVLNSLDYSRTAASNKHEDQVLDAAAVSDRDDDAAAKNHDEGEEAAIVVSERVTTAAAKQPGYGKRLFVTNFPGDMMASQLNELREEVTCIVRSAKPGDEALVVLESGGGTVTGYGLATAQLLRLKESGMRVTIAVEQVAASGGYMMCCVADKIVGSPFAVFGSIGVVAQIPNVYDRLKKEGVEFQTVTAGKFKRTITPFKKVTPEDLKKTEEDIEDVFGLFRDFVGKNRPLLNIQEVATGETWFGTDALEKKLCDEIGTVDDILVEYVDDGWEVYEVRYTPPKKGGTLGRSTSNAEGRNKSSSSSLLSGMGWLVRSSTSWFVRMVASEIRSELADGTDGANSIEKRYMARYDDSLRMQG